MVLLGMWRSVIHLRLLSIHATNEPATTAELKLWRHKRKILSCSITNESIKTPAVVPREVSANAHCSHDNLDSPLETPLVNLRPSQGTTYMYIDRQALTPLVVGFMPAQKVHEPTPYSLWRSNLYAKQATEASNT
jgi:hypothetical protein